jgi:hypothetical protein
MQRTYFVISFDDKVHADSLGAKWDWGKKLNYAPNERVKKALLPFYKEYKPFQGFVGENRTFGGNQLFVDMIPRTSFYRNVRAMIYKGDWSIISRYIGDRVGNKCECCGIDCTKVGKDPLSYGSDLITLEELSGVKLEDIPEIIIKQVGLNPEEWPEDLFDFYYNGKEQLNQMKKTVEIWNTPRLEAHERWSYNEETKIQKLERIIALCHRCHSLTHHGLAGIRQVHKFAEKHLMKTNEWTEEQVSEHCTEQWSLWKERSKIEWILDVSLISNSGLEVVPIKMTKKQEEETRRYVLSPEYVFD